MQSLAVSIFIVFAVSGGFGAPQQSGIDNFWTDDYKLFEQIYGRTSDRDIYKTGLQPLNQAYGFDARKIQLQPINEAIDKKERLNLADDTSAASTNQDPYQATATSNNNQDLYPQYANALAHTLKNDISPTKPTFKFVGYNEFKPISQNTDPETYNYLKHLDLLTKQQNIGFPLEGLNGFKPFLQQVYPTTNPEQTDAYKSIQDILDAHEAAKEKQRKDKQKKPEEQKYVTYGQGRSNKKPAVRYVHNNDISRPSRCASGRCRKRVTSGRYYKLRPVVTRIKHRIVSDD